MGSYSIYFERDAARSHISRAEWLDALLHTPGVRRAGDATADPHGWIGYWVNPHGGPGQFHHNAYRAYDAEVFFADGGTWRRAIYWHSMYGRPGSEDGVVTFEAPPSNVDKESYPVSVAARALAERLGAELVGEDETAYEA
jgi:hypothetical protein